ncbi:MAG: gamma-glutamylcyclotransferase [Candidatus Thiodiazotropha sp. (ex. Lucinisca nassula)]|nr:gamma-glutamylcyclotransferase [Candidatus Thiodiazotropha sp. (ex. Lucinisca nassula)]
MLYFAYGSNMSSRRLRERVPSAQLRFTATLEAHQLCFHKRSRDGSAKCDALETHNPQHRVIGVVFEIAQTEKTKLDWHEGLGNGYEEKQVTLLTGSADSLTAFTYYATHIDSLSKPYSWYKHHVLRGAREHQLPATYLDRIERIEAIIDPNSERHALEMAIYLDELV